MSVVIHDNIVTIEVSSSPSITTEVISSPSVTTSVVGIQGPSGEDGLDAEGALYFSFSWGDATPKFLTTVKSDKPIIESSIYMVVPMNGEGATLSIGDSIENEKLMSIVENVPSTIGGNISYPSHAYENDTAIYLYITPGSGCSMGSGVVTLQIKT